MNIIATNLSRLRLFLARTSLVGIPTTRALAWELPRLLAWRAYNRLASLVYALMDRQRVSDRRTARALQRFTGPEGIYFYVIAVPRALHFLIPAASLIQRHARIVFVLNGVSRTEEQALRDRFPAVPTLRLWTLPGTCWPHGHLLSVLLRSSGRDFGIIDHDFFLFDDTVFEQLRFAEDEFAVCADAWRNAPTGSEVPTTHFMYLHTRRLQEVMRHHGVGAQLYKTIPGHLSDMLANAGFSMRNPPKEYQSFFDSFLMLSVLAVQDGYRFRKLDTAPEGWVHVGGTSMGRHISKDAVHHYVSSRFLEWLEGSPVYEEYRRKGLATPDMSKRLRDTLDTQIAHRVDLLVDRVGKRMAALSTPP